jgi:hypothetical protein
MADSNELVPFDKYEIAQADPHAVIEAVQANLGGQKLSPNDLDVVKMPSGGGLFWEVPDLEDTKAEKALEGVIVHHNLTRAYWKDDLDDAGGGQPPDCFSPDSVWGFGDPGDGLRAEGKGCEDCPMSQFGTADDGDGRGQACKQSHLLFLVTPGDMLPIVVRLAPTSLKPTKKFLLRLSSKAVPYYAVVARIGLEKKTSAGGQDYAAATFSVAKRLGADDASRVKAFGDALRPVFEQTAAQEARAAAPTAGADEPAAA